MRQHWHQWVQPDSADETAWELFHENSKMDRFTHPMDDPGAIAWMQQVSQTLSYDQLPAVPLPQTSEPLTMALGEAIAARRTPQRLSRDTISLESLTTILHSAYGVTQSAAQSRARRPLRSVPSAGALFPLEIFFHTRSVTDLEPGLYHYNPIRHELRRLRQGDQAAKIASALMQKQLAVEASLILMIGAMLERSVGKYGDRGYRFALLEAGHVAQNINLAACALGLASIDLGGYQDRLLDRLLGFDGLLQSVLYAVAVGGIVEDPEGL